MEKMYRLSKKVVNHCSTAVDFDLATISNTTFFYRTSTSTWFSLLTNTE